MKKEFSISGTGETKKEQLQSLVEIEPILVMLGYDREDESWNNENASMEDYPGDLCPFILCSQLGSPQYHNHNGKYEVNFKANEIDKIIDYVLS